MTARWGVRASIAQAAIQVCVDTLSAELSLSVFAILWSPDGIGDSTPSIRAGAGADAAILASAAEKHLPDERRAHTKGPQQPVNSPQRISAWQAVDEPIGHLVIPIQHAERHTPDYAGLLLIGPVEEEGESSSLLATATRAARRLGDVVDDVGVCAPERAAWTSALESVAQAPHEDAIWPSVEAALLSLVSDWSLDGASLYLAENADYRDLTMRVSVPNDDAEQHVSFAFRSQEELLATASDAGVLVELGSGDRSAPLAWVDSSNAFGFEKALVFAASFQQGVIVALAVGVSRRMPSPLRRQILASEIQMELFRCLELTLFGVGRNITMAEMGHLIGRASGKITSGVQALMAEVTDAQADSRPRSRQLREAAEWAIEDGLTRLNLIYQNFSSMVSPTPIGVHGLDEHRLLSAKVFDAINVLQGLCGFFRRAATGSGLRPTIVELGCERAPIIGNADRLRLVLLNIFDNALKFSYKDTYISVDAKCTGTTLTVTFRNLGIGVASDEAARVFQRGYRSRFRDASRSIPGLGMGLSFCKAVVEKELDGAIRLHSRPAHLPSPRRFQGDNWLTTVTIEVPLATEESDSSEDPAIR